MSVCTFFGHRDCPSSIKPKLKQALVYLIETQSVDTFYVGTHGAFDAMVRSSLAELMQDYPHIRCTVVLAYLPTKKLAYPFPSLLPDGMKPLRNVRHFLPQQMDAETIAFRCDLYHA